MQRNQNPCAGGELGAAAMENSLAILQKLKNRTNHMIQQFHFWVYTPPKNEK